MLSPLESIIKKLELEPEEKLTEKEKLEKHYSNIYEKELKSFIATNKFVIFN